MPTTNDTSRSGELTGLGVLLDLPVGRLHYRGRRLLGLLAELHLAVDLLAHDTVPETDARKRFASRDPRPADPASPARAPDTDTPTGGGAAIPVRATAPAANPAPAAPASGQLAMASVAEPDAPRPDPWQRARSRRASHAHR